MQYTTANPVAKHAEIEPAELTQTMERTIFIGIRWSP